MKHYLSGDSGIFLELPEYNEQLIRSAIVEQLNKNPSDLIEHLRDFSAQDQKKYYGKQCVNVYECNPKTGHPSLIVTKGNRVFYRPLVEIELPF